ncbi:PilW family protein [Roseimaritima ulvae]|uniref:General secretion pathway GspH domain-containing protein n=1 Tax=Roseimaritima ulvae TaxID=980254 RepID=A0A5B9QKR1_9BACT|nr:hypothetical protein [Roseimaritima ulvae]QEG38579.1 hypothetical protein UC8_05360 [Roseimaritima ulvae]
MINRRTQTPRSRRRGMSLLEVSIASMMSVMVVLGASSFCHTMTRTLADSIAQTRQAMDTRMVVESLRRDLAGALPDQHDGSRNRWTLVGRQLVGSDELWLCYDGDGDGAASWSSPDRVIRYEFADQCLRRIDTQTGSMLLLADRLASVQFQLTGGQISVTCTTAAEAFPAEYHISAPDLP